MHTFWLGLSDDVMESRLLVLKAQKIEVNHYENKGVFIDELSVVINAAENTALVVLSMNSMKMALELCGLIKGLSPSKTSILLITASTDVEKREAFIKAGGTEIIIEPAGILEILTRLLYYHNVEKQKLQLENEAMQSADMVGTVMESSGDIGKVLEFARNVVAHRGYKEIAETMLEFCQHHFAHSLIEIKSHSEALHFSNEQITDDDLGTLSKQRSGGRIVRSEGCLQINQEYIALYMQGFKQNDINIGGVSDTISSLTELANRYIFSVNAENHMLNVEVQRQKSLDFISKEILSSVNITRGVTGKLADLKVGTPLGEAPIKALKIANDNVNRLSRLIKFVLQINRQSSQDIIADNKSFNVADLLEKMLNVYSAPAKDKSNNTIKTKTQKNCCLISNEIIITQIICQLIDNAIKFTKDSVITLSAKTLVSATGETVEITISDTGQGLTEHELAAFNMHEEVDSGKQMAAGFGLLYIRFYCPVLGGKLTATSAKGKGSTFTFNFLNILPPVAQTKDADVELF